MSNVGNRDRRYDRQMVFEGLGPQGQRRLAGGRVLMVGVGGLGCTVVDLLARAGVGFLRLVDDDAVTAENLHRQVLYDEQDAAERKPKVIAAAERIARINSQVKVEPIVARLDAHNAEPLAEGIDVIVDGTDSFPARFIINDLAVKRSLPWVFAGVVGSEAQTMTIVPGRTPCLRCVLESPPPPCQEPTCRSAGVIPPAVVAVAAIQAAEVMKLLSGHVEAISPWLVKMDLWTNAMQRVNVTEACAGAECRCCKRREFDYLAGGA